MADVAIKTRADLIAAVANRLSLSRATVSAVLSETNQLGVVLVRSPPSDAALRAWLRDVMEKSEIGKDA